MQIASIIQKPQKSGIVTSHLSSRPVKGSFTIPKMGDNIPHMGHVSTSLSEALFTGVQQRVLGLLFGQPDRSFYGNELLRLTGTGKGALQRELGKLVSSGLITMTAIGNQNHYQANRQAPIFEELRGIVLKTFGLADVLREALQPLGSRIRVAFAYGSVAKGTDTASSDIDVMVVGEGIAYGELFEQLTAAESRLGRKVNPTLYTVKELKRRIAEDSHFITRVLEQPKIFLIGNMDAIPTRKSPETE